MTLSAEKQKEYDDYTFKLKVITAPLGGGFVLFLILAIVFGNMEYSPWKKNLETLFGISSFVCFIAAIITMIFFLMKRKQVGN